MFSARSIDHRLQLCYYFWYYFNIGEALINQSANVFVFGYINVQHNDWLTYSSGINRPGENSKRPYSNG